MEDHLFNFPIEKLPRTCIYTLDFLHIQEFYETENTCVCGNDEWIDSIIISKIDEVEFDMPPQRIQRCKKCGLIRKSKLKRIYEKIIDLSEEFSKMLINLNLDKRSLMWIIKNALRNVENHFSSEISNQIKFEIATKKKEKKNKSIETDAVWLNYMPFDIKSIRPHET